MNISHTKNSKFRLPVTACACLVFLLAGCGGGGGEIAPAPGTNAAAPAAPIATAPTTPGAITPVTSGVPATLGTLNPNTTSAYFTALTATGLKQFTAGVVAQLNVLAQLPSGVTQTAAIAGTVANQNLATVALNAGAWVNQAQTGAYYLNAAGTWVADNAVVQMTSNPNGSVTLLDPYLGAMNLTPNALNIAGRPIAYSGIPMQFQLPTAGLAASSSLVNVNDQYAMNAQGNGGAAMFSNAISANAVYPAGSIDWLLTGGVSSQDSYAILDASRAPFLTNNSSASYSTSNAVSTPISMLINNLNVANASVFTASNPLCFDNLELVYSATQPVPAIANSARFDVYTQSMNMSAAGAYTCVTINTVTAPAGYTTNTPLGTVDADFMTVRTQAITRFSNFVATAGSPLASPFFTTDPFQAAIKHETFLAVVNGGLKSGLMQTAGWSADLDAISRSNGGGNITGRLNKTAMDAVMTAAGLPLF